MDAAEIDRWSAGVPRAAVRAMADHAAAVSDVWRSRLLGAEELIPLMDWCPQGTLAPAVAAHMAAHAAIEMAIICAIWPQPLDVVLRPGNRANARR